VIKKKAKLARKGRKKKVFNVLKNWMFFPDGGPSKFFTGAKRET
jgi:hypothetical protein